MRRCFITLLNQPEAAQGISQPRSTSQASIHPFRPSTHGVCAILCRTCFPWSQLVARCMHAMPYAHPPPPPPSPPPSCRRYVAGLSAQLVATLLHLLALATPPDAARVRDLLSRRADFLTRCVLEGQVMEALAPHWTAWQHARALRAVQAHHAVSPQLLPSDPFGLSLPSTSAAAATDRGGSGGGAVGAGAAAGGHESAGSGQADALAVGMSSCLSLEALMRACSLGTSQASPDTDTDTAAASVAGRHAGGGGNASAADLWEAVAAAGGEAATAPLIARLSALHGAARGLAALLAELPAVSAAGTAAALALASTRRVADALEELLAAHRVETDMGL